MMLPEEYIHDDHVEDFKMVVPMDTNKVDRLTELLDPEDYSWEVNTFQGISYVEVSTKKVLSLMNLMSQLVMKIKEEIQLESKKQAEMN